jgi:type IV fimbrial biogenesis protein FimT
VVGSTGFNFVSLTQMKIFMQRSILQKTAPSEPSRQSVRGFTLIELMVTLAIVVIASSIAIPSWRSITASNNIRGMINDWTLSTQFAKAEAIKRNISITVCPSSNGLTCTNTGYEGGWIVTTGAGLVLQDYLPRNLILMNSNQPNPSLGLTFLPTGQPAGNFAGFRLSAQYDSSVNDLALERYVCVARTGRSRVMKRDDFLNVGC